MFVVNMAFILILSNRIQSSPIGLSMASDNPQTETQQSPGQEASQKMKDYTDYIAEVKFRYPETFKTLDTFIQRGNCKCSENCRCLCTEIGQLCLCTCKPKLKEDKAACLCGSKTKDSNSTCEVHRVHHEVRIYDIDHTASEPEDFFKILDGGEGKGYYDAGDSRDFEALKEAVVAGWRAKAKESHYRLITVSHLSANVAKLLGGLYDIPADFFNRHLPGTEAISGRLLSRLPSSLQIDFDELYEATKTFQEIWQRKENKKDPDGHRIIRSSLEQNFLFQQVGWDYFPISNRDWKMSRNNTPMSSGFETKDASIENVFQFNLTHRVSVYSSPQGHPSTGWFFIPRET